MIPVAGWGAFAAKTGKKVVQSTGQPGAPDFTGSVLPVTKYGPNDPPVRIDGDWSVNDMKAALLGHPPKGLGKPDLHHADQMPGSGLKTPPFRLAKPRIQNTRCPAHCYLALQ